MLNVTKVCRCGCVKVVKVEDDQAPKLGFENLWLCPRTHTIEEYKVTKIEPVKAETNLHENTHTLVKLGFESEDNMNLFGNSTLPL